MIFYFLVTDSVRVGAIPGHRDVTRIQLRPANANLRERAECASRPDQSGKLTRFVLLNSFLYQILYDLDYILLLLSAAGRLSSSRRQCQPCQASPDGEQRYTVGSFLREAKR